jgi:hypothetical protein
MELLDGLHRYQEDESEWKFTQETEAATRRVVNCIDLYGNQPTPTALKSAQQLLVQIEKWKAMCLKQRMGSAAQNSQRDVWTAFRGALDAKNDTDAILSIMQLKGFGSSRDEESGQRRAKVATAALRFLKPTHWGVVDWRTAAMLGCLQKSGDNVDQALSFAKNEDANCLRNTFDIIDEKAACAINQQYRDRKVDLYPRTVDVEMAIFGLSLMAWPMKN